MRGNDKHGHRSVTIHRIASGAIDVSYYKNRAHTLRARWLRRWLHQVVSRIASHWRRHAAETELYSLDDRTLHDIGFSRSEIPAIVSGDYRRDTTRRQRVAQPVSGLDPAGVTPSTHFHPLNRQKEHEP